MHVCVGAACSVVLYVVRQLVRQPHHLQLRVDRVPGRVSSGRLPSAGVRAEAGRLGRDDRRRTHDGPVCRARHTCC